MPDKSLENIPYQSEQVLRANGVEINYDCFGNERDPAVLMIMGLATQLIHWDEAFCQMLASQGFRVIRFDNRDIGKSSLLQTSPTPNVLQMLGNQLVGTKLEAPYTLDTMATDSLALMDGLDIAAAHVVGVSMGGMIAQCMALKAPQRVLSLTSIMSTTGNRALPKPKPSVTMKLVAPAPKNEQAYIANGLKVWQMLHGSHFPFEADRIRQLLSNSYRRCFYPPGILRQLSAIIASPDRTPALTDLAVPTLVMHGNQDPLVPVECGIATAEAVSKAKLKIFDGMGHTLPRQVWQDMVTEICDIAS